MAVDSQMVLVSRAITSALRPLLLFRANAVTLESGRDIGATIEISLGGVREGFAFCLVQDGGSIARLSVFAERPAETAIAQKIGFNRDREGVISGHFNTMRAWRNVFQPAIWP